MGALWENDLRRILKLIPTATLFGIAKIQAFDVCRKSREFVSDRLKD